MFLLGIICYTTIDIWGATSGSLDTENNDEIMFNINVPNISIVFFDTRGYNMTAKDQNDKELYYYPNYYLTYYIDFGLDSGTVNFRKNGETNSAFNYSAIKFPNNCTGLRMVSIGDSHYFSISGSGSRNTDNFKMRNDMDYCIWLVSESNQEFFINYKTEPKYDYFSVHYENDILMFTGMGSKNIYTTSLLVVWKTDFSELSEDLSIYANTPSDFATKRIYYLTSVYSQIPIYESKSLYVDIRSFQYFEYPTDDFTYFIFHSTQIDSSIAFHNIFYNIRFISYDGEVNDQIYNTDLKFFDFGDRKGFCSVYTNDNYIRCSMICYSCLGLHDSCRFHRSVSYGNYQNFLLSKYSVNNLQKNRTITNEKGCLWMTSSILSKYYIENSFDQSTSIRIETPKYHGGIISGTEYENTVLLMWDIRSAFDGYLLIQGRPYDINDIKDRRSIGIQYSYQSFALASPKGMRTPIEIKKTSTYDLYLGESNPIDLIISVKNVLLSIQTVQMNQSIELKGFALNNDLLFDHFLVNDTAIIEVGLDLSFIQILTSDNGLVNILINVLDLSNTQIIDKCSNGIIALVGNTNKIEISSREFKNLSNVNIPYTQNDDVCFWIPYCKTLEIYTESESNIGYDRMLLYTQTALENHTHPIVISGNNKANYYFNEQIIMNWESVEMNSETCFEFKYNHIESISLNNSRAVYLNRTHENTKYIINSNLPLRRMDREEPRNLTTYLFTTNDYSIDISKIDVLEIVIPIRNTILMIHDHENYDIEFPIFEINSKLQSSNLSEKIMNGTYNFYGHGRRIFIKKKLNVVKKILLSCLVYFVEKTCPSIKISQGFFDVKSIESLKESNSISCFWLTSNETRQYSFHKSNDDYLDYFEVSYFHETMGYSKKKFSSNNTANQLTAQSIFVIWNHSSRYSSVISSIRINDENDYNQQQQLGFLDLSQKKGESSLIFLYFVFGTLLPLSFFYIKSKTFQYYFQKLMNGVFSNNDEFELSDQEQATDIPPEVFTHNVEINEEEEKFDDE